MPDLLYEKHADRHYAIFTMNRPERLNALGGTMQQDLDAALLDFTNDIDMRVGILTGTGRAFSAGADLKEMSERNTRSAAVEERFARGEISAEERVRQLAAAGRIRSRPLSATFPFSTNPKPFIAAINGLCIAGGCERALDCDIRIASTEAYFGLFEVKRGILAGYAIHHAARIMPFGEAMYLVLTGDTMSVQDAHRMGLVHEIIEPARVVPRAVEIAETIASNAPLSVQGSKAIMQFWRQYALGESLRLAEWVNQVVLTSEDSREGPRAFAEKRKPVWKGR
ncbi:MAG: enoyl-CoA hydratase [SAR202 cluster bacterium]|nr:enoyl-CoA hydratase [SAR202 cluster bacterium]